MADQRRYSPQVEQNIKYLRSGERSEAAPWYERYGKQAAIAIPEALLDTASLVGTVAQAGAGTLDYAMSDDPKLGFGQAIRNQFYGEKGAKEIDDFQAQRRQQILSQMPKEKQSDPAIIDQVDAAIEGSMEYADFVNARRSGSDQTLIAADRAMRDAMGMKYQEQDTWTDDATKLVASSIVPSKWLKLGLNTAQNAPRAMRVAGRFIEPFLPGHTGSVKSVAANIGIGGAASEGARALIDMPAAVTGDPLLAEQYREDAAPQEAPQQQPPFQVAPNAGIPEQNQINGLRVRPTSPAASTQPTAAVGNVSAPAVAKEEHGGLGGSIIAYGMAGLSAAGVAALAIKGRKGRGMAGEVIRDVNTDDAAKLAEPTANDAAIFGPVLTGRQRALAGGADKRKPITDVVRDAYRAENDPELKNLIGNIERQNLEATTVEIYNKVGHSWNTGYIPNLGRNTYSPKQLLAEFEQLGDVKKDVSDAMILESRLQDYAKTNVRLEDEIADIRNKINLRSKMQGRNAKIAELAEKEKALTARLGEDSMLTKSISVKDARAKISLLDQNPQTRQFVSNYRKIQDDIMEARIGQGWIDRETADAIRAGNQSYVPVIQDPYEGRTGLQKVGQQTLEGFKGRSERRLDKASTWHTSMYANRRVPIAERKGSVEDVEHALDVMSALHNTVYNYHHFAATNNAKRTFVNAILRSSKWGAAVRKAHEPVSVSEYNRKGIDRKVDKNAKVFSVVDNGMIHFYEAADEELALALRYNPGATVAGLSNIRRLTQSMTTGPWAPWFAPVTAIYEAKAARATLKRGRVLGPVHAAIDKAFPNSKVMQYTGDPALIPSLVVSSLRGITDEGMRVVGEFLANDLRQNSRLFKEMDHMMGQGWAQKVGKSLVKGYNETWTSMMREKGILGGTVTEEVNADTLKGFGAIRQYIGDSKLGPMADMYLASLESIRNSTKHGFFVSNYRKLHRKYEGQIPEKEIESLVYDTKTLSGDMTKARGWEPMAQVESVTPYMSVSINSTAHVLQAIAQEPMMVGSRILTSAVLPKVMWISALTATVPGFSEWFWDDQPSWERMKKVPMLGPNYVLSVFTDGPRAPTIDDIVSMPSAPEFTLLTEPLITGMRAAGAFGQHGAETVRPVQEWGEAISSLVSVPANPLIKALSGGQDIDFARGVTGWMTGKSMFEPPIESSTNMGMSATGETTKKFQEAIGAMFGSATKVAMMGLEPFTQEIGEGNVGEAFTKLFSYPAKGFKEQLPETPLSPLYQSREQYRGTEQRSRITETMKKAEEVIDQISVQKRDARRAGFNLPGTTDPKAREMMDDIRVSMNTGMMNNLKKQRSDLNAQIARVEENRDKMSPNEFYELKNTLIKDMHATDDRMEFIIEQLNARLTTNYQTDLDGAIDYIRSTVQ